jgi:hypothetical protein
MHRAQSGKSDVGLLIAVAVVGILVFVGAALYLGALGERALSGGWDGAMTELRLMLGGSSALLAISSVVLGVQLRRSGAKTLAQHRYPPDGSERVVGLPVSDGASADRLGARLRLFGALVMIFGIAAAATGFALVTKI